MTEGNACVWRDPIVDEIREYRDEYAARFNYDIEAICRAAREHQEKGNRGTVSLPPKRVDRPA
jgi:hypothetical protein